MSIESDSEMLVNKLIAWAGQDRQAATTALSELKSYWLGRADGWEEAASHLRLVLDENATHPEFDWKSIYVSVAVDPQSDSFHPDRR